MYPPVTDIRYWRLRFAEARLSGRPQSLALAKRAYRYMLKLHIASL